MWDERNGLCGDGRKKWIENLQNRIYTKGISSEYILEGISFNISQLQKRPGQEKD